jgi:hypothetical protein
MAPAMQPSASSKARGYARFRVESESTMAPCKLFGYVCEFAYLESRTILGVMAKRGDGLTPFLLLPPSPFGGQTVKAPGVGAQKHIQHGPMPATRDRVRAAPWALARQCAAPCSSALPFPRTPRLPDPDGARGILPHTRAAQLQLRAPCGPPAGTHGSRHHEADSFASRHLLLSPGSVTLGPS